MWKDRSVKLPVLLWFSLAIAAVVAELFRNSINNYYIFKGVFWHTLAQTNLYTQYPQEYFDTNHYGPFFSLVIAPFAILPDWLGVLCWCVFNSFILFYAINKLPFSTNAKLAILTITAVEMMTSIHSVQANAMLAGWLILAFVLSQERKDFWAAFFIAAGFMTKIYGIAGLVFLVFSRDKIRFSLSFLFWIGVMFLLPMLYSSPGFIATSYFDWLDALVQKNSDNIAAGGTSLMQDISLMGFLRRSFGLSSSYNMLVIGIGMLIIVLPLLRFKHFNSARFRLSYLAIALISVVIFSTSAESPTYIIAVAGVAVWYMTFPRTFWSTSILLLTLVITCFSGTDLFPAYVRDHFISPYSIKAVPCILVWCVLAFNLMFKKFIAIPKSIASNETHQHHIASMQ